LLESELFGHVAGAFTGATHNKTGKFHQADGGTIFLDEIGTASTALQVKLLRVLQEMHFEPLGSLETIQTDARVILATNEDLGRAVAEGRFRQDLFYRINVIHLELPSLRQRLDDLPLLIEHFLQDACKEFGRKVEGLTPAALEILRRYRWPGNIRELENVVQRAVLLCKSDWIDIPHLPQAVLTGVSAADAPRPGAGPSGQDGNFVAGLSISSLAPGQTLREALDGPERQIILDVLQRNQWNRNLTAEKLGINRTTLYKKIKRLGIEELSPTDSV
jgi:DNA-binding NtrC family response regulator